MSEASPFYGRFTAGIEEDSNDLHETVLDAEDELKAYRRSPVAGEPSTQRRKHLLRAVQLIGQALEAEKRADAALGLGDGA